MECLYRTSQRNAQTRPSPAGFPLGTGVILLHKPVVDVLLRPFPGLDRLFKVCVAPQVAPFALEADGCSPSPLGRQPVHAGDAAGVVAPDGLGTQHLDAGAVHIGQGRQALSGAAAPAAGGVPLPQPLGQDDGLLPAVAPAPPRGPVPDVLRRTQHQQLSVPLPGEIQFFP